MSIIALIPARSGSQRIPDKNIKDFMGHPLMAYTIQVAKDSGLFGEHIYVSSDSPEYLKIAEKHGARGIPRPARISGALSPDSAWIKSALGCINRVDFKSYFILRPTNPFRSVEMLKSGAEIGLPFGMTDRIKAVQRVKEHPHKMWCIFNINHGTSEDYWGHETMQPGFDEYGHLEQSSTLPQFCVQNGSLEIRLRTSTDKDAHYMPFFTTGYEGFDINTPEDWILAEELVKRGMAKLPEVK